MIDGVAEMTVVGVGVHDMSATAVAGAVALGSAEPDVDCAVSCSGDANALATAACAFCAIKWTCWRPSANTEEEEEAGSI